MTSPSTSIWLRRSGESAEAYLAFKTFLELGPERTIIAAYRQSKGRPQAEQPPGVWNAWVAKFDWHNRAAAWDTNNDITTQIAREAALADEAVKWAKRQARVREEGWHLFEQLSKKAEQMISYPLTRSETKDEKTVVYPTDWNLNTAARVADTALKLGRLAADLATEIFDFDVDKLSDRELDAAKHAIRQGKPVAKAIAETDRD